MRRIVLGVVVGLLGSVVTTLAQPVPRNLMVFTGTDNGSSTSTTVAGVCVLDGTENLALLTKVDLCEIRNVHSGAINAQNVGVGVLTPGPLATATAVSSELFSGGTSALFLCMRGTASYYGMGDVSSDEECIPFSSQLPICVP